MVVYVICSTHSSVYVNCKLLIYPSPRFPFVNRIETLNQSFVLLQSPRIFKPNGSSKIRIEAEYFASLEDVNGKDSRLRIMFTVQLQNHFGPCLDGGIAVEAPFIGRIDTALF